MLCCQKKLNEQKMMVSLVSENGIALKILIQCVYGSKKMHKNHNTETKLTRFISTIVSLL